MKGRTNDALDMIKAWVRKYHHRIGAKKSDVFYLRGKKRSEGINLRLGKTFINVNHSARPLSMVLNAGLANLAHIKYAAEVGHEPSKAYA